MTTIDYKMHQKIILRVYVKIIRRDGLIKTLEDKNKVFKEKGSTSDALKIREIEQL